jgi:hypothetical protein
LNLDGVDGDLELGKGIGRISNDAQALEVQEIGGPKALRQGQGITLLLELDLGPQVLDRGSKVQTLHGRVPKKAQVGGIACGLGLLG